jgi:outer membrane scaffolding protein for murein synthesis (MipA/OmpV family)
LIWGPEFEGSDEYEFHVVPVVSVRYKRLFLSTRQGLGFKAIDTGTLTVSPFLNYAPARDESDSDLLKGLGDVDDYLETGVAVTYSPGFFHPNLSYHLTAATGWGNKGSTLDLGASLSLPLEENTWKMGLSLMFADSEYNQKYFGITPIQSAHSGYPVYSPKAGLKHVAFSSSRDWALNEWVSFVLFGQYRLLTGPAADSPIVERGSKNQFILGTSLNLNLNP